MKIKSYLRSPSFWILSAIIIVGVFLRVYHINDWVRFGPDQARDALIIKNVLEGKSVLPLLGPQAGNTSFYLGPIYYYFEYAAGWLFGPHVVSFIVPIILFSILAIPLFYFLLKKIFDEQISLALTAISTLSYFILTSSRYASNTNFIPFFLLLFLLAVLQLSDKKAKNIYWWYGLWGIALGVGIQLHTLLFISLPVVSLLALFFVYRSHALKTKGIVLAAICCLLVNFGAVKYDLETGGSNIQAFFKNALSTSDPGTASKGESKFMRNLRLVTACQLEANVQILFPLENREECDILNFPDLNKNNPSRPISNHHALEFLGLLIFSVGGYSLLFYYLFRKETSADLKRFLWLALVFNLVTFFIFIPVASEIGVRYFIVLAFMPFVLLGLWIKGFCDLRISEQFKKYFSLLIVFALILGNIYVIFQNAQKFAKGEASDDRLSVLGEIRPVAEFIMEKAEESKDAYIDGDREYVSRFTKALGYLTQEKSVTLNKWRSDADNIDGSAALFDIEPADSKKTSKDGQLRGRPVIAEKKVGNIIIYLLEK